MTPTAKQIEALQTRLVSIKPTASGIDIGCLTDIVLMLLDFDTVDDVLALSDKKLREVENLAILYMNDFTGSTRTDAIGSATAAAIQETIDKKDENTVEINSIYNASNEIFDEIINDFDLLNDVPDGSSIMPTISTEGRKMDFWHKDNAQSNNNLPFIFGVLSRYDDYFGTGTLTSSLGAWYSSGADYMLQLLGGCHTYSTSYAGFYLEPKLCYLQGANGNFIKKKSYAKYKVSTSQATYPCAALGVMFVQNTTDSGISSTLYFGGSSYWSSNYEGASMFVGIPNKNNSEKDEISSISWSNVYSYSSTTTGFSGSASITIPANTTVSVIFYTSSYYYVVSGRRGVEGDHMQFLEWYLSNVRSNFLKPGLAIDMEKTRNAWQCKGLANTYELWR